MPNSNTFEVPPIGEFVKSYLQNSTVSIDPFARNKRWAIHTNDLNPETEAEYHMEAEDFLAMLAQKNVRADLIIFDPPYSLRQAKEVYEKYSEWKFEHTQNAVGWYKEKKLCSELLLDGGVFLHFGWHSNGLGKKYNTAIEEVLLVAHGGTHNDTICIAERKL